MAKVRHVVDTKKDLEMSEEKLHLYADELAERLKATTDQFIKEKMAERGYEDRATVVIDGSMTAISWWATDPENVTSAQSDVMQLLPMTVEFAHACFSREHLRLISKTGTYIQ